MFGIAFVSGLLLCGMLPINATNTISESHEQNVFSVIKRKSWKAFTPHPNTKSSKISALLNLCNSLFVLSFLSYCAPKAFEYLMSSILFPKMAKATGFVMANLVLIYPSQGGNASTISGLAGFIIFCIGAAAIHFTKPHSSEKAIFMLKYLPILFACTEAIYEEKYGSYVKDGKSFEPNQLGTRLNCILGSTLITAGFISGDYFTQKLCSSTMLTSNTLKFLTEALITPVSIIVASAICTKMCNRIGKNFAEEAKTTN